MRLMRRPKAVFQRLPYFKEANLVYFKPYLTWAFKARVEGPEYTFNFEETHQVYRERPRAHLTIIEMNC